MRSIRRNIYCFPSLNAQFLTTKGRFNLTFQDNERFLKIMPVQRRTTARWNLHVDDAESPIGVRPCDSDRVGAPDEADMRKAATLIRLGMEERAAQIIRGNFRCYVLHFFFVRFFVVLVCDIEEAR